MANEILKDLAFYKANAEEDYITTPISVLRYISELEKQKAPEMLEMLKIISNGFDDSKKHLIIKKSKQLIKQATEL